MTIYSTSNLPKLLNNAKDDGWRILGAAVADSDSSGRDGSNSHDDEDDGDEIDHYWSLGENDSYDDQNENVQTIQQKKIQQQPRYYELDDVETGFPTILVLGSEGE